MRTTNMDVDMNDGRNMCELVKMPVSSEEFQQDQFVVLSSGIYKEQLETFVSKKLRHFT